MKAGEPRVHGRPRGMRDLLPAEMRAFRRVEDVFRAAAERWGYGEIRTPTLEEFGLLTEAGALTPEMLGRVYTFLDWDGWSGERVVLRPDSTVPVARAVADSGLATPARLFYVQSAFRFDPAGADSETWQCGLEYIGAGGLLADLEVAAIGFEVLDAVAPGSALHLSHAGFAIGVIGLIEASGVAVPPDMRDAVTARGIGELAPLAANVAGAAALLELAKQPSDDVALLANVAGVCGDSAGLAEAVEDCTAIATALKQSGRRVVLHIGMPADFGYYNGPVFEFRGRDRLWGRGGRYALSPALGGHASSGLGLDATALASQVTLDGVATPSVAVIPVDAADLGRAIEVARTLHRSDIPAALFADPGDGYPLAVRVTGGRLQARTPEGMVDLATLDELLPLLLQFK